MKIAFSGDIHLGSGLRHGPLVEGKAARINDWINSFNFFLQHTEDCDIVCLLGDYFLDSRPEPWLLKIFFNELVYKILDRNQQIIMIAGNHDIRRGEFLFSFLEGVNENIFIVDKPSFLEVKGQKFWCLPHISFKYYEEEAIRKLLQQQYRAAASDNIVLFHGCVEGFMNEFANNEFVFPKRWIKKFKEGCVACAHIHIQDLLYPNCFYTGSLEKVSFGEKDHANGFVIFEDNDIRLIKTPAREMEVVKVRSLSDFKKINVEEKIVRIDVTNPEITTEEIQEELKKMNAYHVYSIHYERENKETGEIEPSKIKDISLNNLFKVFCEEAGYGEEVINDGIDLLKQAGSL